MIEQLIEEPKPLTQVSSTPPRCPDYDCDCKDVPNPTNCFLGTKHLGVAKGYCPYAQTSN